MTHQSEVIGLLPAAGVASRLGPLPISKEIYPIGFDTNSAAPRVVSHSLLRSMKRAGIETAYFILRPGKWDIPGYFGDGKIVQMDIAYLMMGAPYGVPYTLDQARRFVEGKRVAVGFPDILFEPPDAFVHLIDRQETTDADVVLGLFPTDRPQKMDMVRTVDNGRVAEIVIKPQTSELRYSWSIVVWKPEFTDFMHRLLQNAEAKLAAEKRELHLGTVIQSAVREGLSVDSVAFPQGRCLDIGTPDDLQRAMHEQLQQP